VQGVSRPPGPRSNAPLLYCLCMLVMLSLSVARSLWRRYDLRAAILPVLWMASYLHIMVQRVTSVRCRVQARRRCCVVNWLSCPKWWRVPPRKGCQPPRRSLQSTIRLYMSPMHSLNHFEESNVIIIKGEWNAISCARRGKSGPALGGTEYRLMPSACRLIVRANCEIYNFDTSWVVHQCEGEV